MSQRYDVSTVDWAGVRARLEEARARLEELARPSPEQERQILRARARELARRLEVERARPERELITFVIGQERYAIESRRVVEIIPLRELVPVPGAPQPIIGIAAWRGTILVVSELRAVTERSASDAAVRRYIVVVGGEDVTFGIPVDGVGEVVAVSAGEIRPVPEGFAGSREVVAGVVHDAVVVLDDDALLRHHAQLS